MPTLTTDSYARKNIETFYENIEMPGGYTLNHVETLKMIDLYYNSRYKTGAYDALGLRKFFFNVVKPACDVASKFIDLDTKDLVLIAEHPGDEFRVWLMQRKLRQWLKDTDFGCLLNDISFNLPKYGTVVLKRVLGDKGYYEWKRVQLQNLRMNPTVECLNDSEFVYELNMMSRTTIKQMKGWDQAMIAELFSRGYDQNFCIYECYEKTVTGWDRTIRGDLFATKAQGGGINRSVETEINVRGRDYYGSLVLYTDTVSELPYRELHWEKSPGRWLGYGFVEYLEENQIAINEAENLERKALIFTSLKFWQTRDENVGGLNILSSAQNGDIFKVDSEISPVNMSSGAELNAFNNTRRNWQSNVERKTFTTDITTGANLPSRTPLGVANLQVSLASSYFELKRENFGLFIKDLIIEDIIPDFEKDANKEHILTFLASDQEIERLDNLLVKFHLDNAVLDYALKTGYFPSQIDRERVKQQLFQQIRGKKNRYLDIPKDFYQNAKYIVDVMVTGESVDNGSKSQVLQLALQILGTNPAILQNPVTKQIFLSLLALGGISPMDIGLTEMTSGQNTAQPQDQGQPVQPQQGGSVALPAMTPGITNQVKTF